MKVTAHFVLIIAGLWVWVAPIDPPNWHNRLSHKPSTLPYETDSITVLLSALDSFQVALNNRWSYRYANKADYPQAIDALRQKIKSGISTDHFAVEIEKIVAMGIDGHSRVRGYNWPAGGCLPFLIEVEGNRFIALQSNHTAFVQDGFPYLSKIDGRPIQQWIDQAATRVPKGATRWIKHRCIVRFLGRLDYWRNELNLPRKETVRVELTDATGKNSRVVELPVAKAPFPYPIWPRQGSRLLASNIGYLRLPTMEKEPSLKEIATWMPQFRNASGLIVDVRDNDGGDRGALLALYSYLASPTAPPHVFTAAAYRLHASRNENHLGGGYFMFREDDARWDPAERLAIQAFKKSFIPEWELPKGQFSPWHYLSLRPKAEPGMYHFDKPVVVLMNAKCFSACDIFLAGLKGVKNVTLLGTPSGGGSGNSESFNLGTTPVRITLSTMASFQASGKLFDRNGVQPDVVLEPELAYYIGGSDSVQEKAVAIIKTTKRE